MCFVILTKLLLIPSDQLMLLAQNVFNAPWTSTKDGPSCSNSHKISKSDSSGGEPVICEQLMLLAQNVLNAPWTSKTFLWTFHH